MENYGKNEEANGQVLSSDEQYEQWSKQHLDLKQQIESIERRPYVTQADELEEQKLKKLKLQLKDQMNGMASSQKQARNT